MYKQNAFKNGRSILFKYRFKTVFCYVNRQHIFIYKSVDLIYQSIPDIAKLQLDRQVDRKLDSIIIHYMICLDVIPSKYLSGLICSVTVRQPVK